MDNKTLSSIELLLDTEAETKFKNNEVRMKAALLITDIKDLDENVKVQRYNSNQDFLSFELRYNENIARVQFSNKNPKIGVLVFKPESAQNPHTVDFLDVYQALEYAVNIIDKPAKKGVMP